MSVLATKMHESSITTLFTDTLTYRPSTTTLRVAVKVASEKWKGFCSLPERIKLLFGYTGDVNFSGAGYELKRGGVNAKSGEVSDNKEDFHVRRDRTEFLLGEAKKVGATEADEFLAAAFAVYDELDPLVEDFVKEVERAFGIKNFARDSLMLRLSMILRFLHYFGECEPGAFLGENHTDKGGFTGHLFESHPGVERLDFHGNWVPMDVAEGESLWFPGLGLQLRSECYLKATWHRIVANEVTAKEGRYAGVCFSNIANNRYYDKKNWGRTQKLPLGLSYTQSFDEFNKMFMERQPE